MTLSKHEHPLIPLRIASNETTNPEISIPPETQWQAVRSTLQRLEISPPESMA